MPRDPAPPDAPPDGAAPAAVPARRGAEALSAPLAEIDLAALTRNAALLAARAGGAALLAAVKADAYGHGALPVARALEGAGVRWFGVATAAEALELRRGGIGGRVLVFGPVPEGADALAELIAARVDLTVAGPADLVDLATAARASASGAAPAARVHLKLDTGMGRIGEGWTGAAERAGELASLGGVTLEGVWTHLAVADEPERDAFTRCQLEAFGGALASLAERGLRPPLAHVANSAGLLRFPEARFDLVRPGIALYGYAAGPEMAAAIDAEGVTLEPVMRLRAPVTFVKTVPPGTPISYGATWRAERTTRIATVRLGYADGYPRALSNRGAGAVGGARARVAGRVCMDQLMLALAPGADARVGDAADLIGGDAPGAGELAARCGTIPYELLVRVGGRVRRRYLGASGPQATEDAPDKPNGGREPSGGREPA